MPKLAIQCTNLRTQNGKLVAVAWKDPATFRSDDLERAAGSASAAIDGEAVTLDFGELPAGKYAVAVLHDENENDKLDVTPLLQLPTEGMAFSRNPKMGLKGPSWDDCAFDLNADTVLPIEIKYWR